MWREGGRSARVAATDGDVDGGERGDVALAVGGRLEEAAVMGRERTSSEGFIGEADDSRAMRELAGFAAATPCAADRGRVFAVAPVVRCGSSCGSF
jgi:hypothetical protein